MPLKGLLPRLWQAPAVLPLGLPLLAIGAWIPALLRLGRTSADQVAESFGITSACQGPRFLLGWLGEGVSAPATAGFSSSRPAQVVAWLSCELSQHSPLNPPQAFLVLGLLLTFGLALLACRRAGFRSDTSLVVAFVITTAPCSFSRIGHLALAMLWPIIPGLLACHGLWRSLQARRVSWGVLGSGAVAGLLCFPAQDYYMVFLVLQILACLALLLFLATTRTLEPAILGRLAAAGCLFVLGFLAIIVLAQSPNLLAVAGAGPPASWVMPRSPNEQFLYGLLPFTWLIPPPWIGLVNQAFVESGVSTATESYWISSGSLLIPIAWLVALWQLARRGPGPAQFSPAQPNPAQPSSADPSRAQGSPVLARPAQPDSQAGAIAFFALLLGLVTFLALFCMTIGGLGTLFAVLVSPVLRSLNRYTVFVYGASVLLLASVLDASLRRRLP